MCTSGALFRGGDTPLTTQIASTETGEDDEDMPSTYDVKYGFQPGDHDGWYLLDGRATSSLANQTHQDNATLLFGNNLPDHRGRYPSHPNPGDVLGQTAGTNSFHIAEQQIPSYDLPVSPGSIPAGALHGGGTTTGSLVIGAGTLNPSSTAVTSNKDLTHDHGMVLGVSSTVNVLTASNLKAGVAGTSEPTGVGDNHKATLCGTPTNLSSWKVYSGPAAHNTHNLNHTHSITVPKVPTTNKTYNVDIALGQVPANPYTLGTTARTRNQGDTQDHVDNRPSTVFVNSFVYLA